MPKFSPTPEQLAIRERMRKRETRYIPDSDILFGDELERYRELELKCIQARGKARSLCGACGEINADFFAVHDELWSAALGNPESDGKEGVIHLRCFEKALGRNLTIGDFKQAPINDWVSWAFERFGGSNNGF